MTQLIIICYRGELYKIPTTFDLMNFNKMTTCFHVHPERGTKEMEVKQLFAMNDVIFQLYLQKSIQEDKLHPNFYMFVDEILYYIKLNSLRENVSEYWKKLL
jgi:hypothetical protein